jgi:hypothetical protein
MTWTSDEQRTIARALLGSWPGTIPGWGKDAFAAFLAELQARNLTAEQVLVAVRSWPAGSDFPPSAPNLAAAARRDPGVPTASEMITLIFGRGGVLSARTKIRKASWEMGERDAADQDAMRERLADMHPIVASFVDREGLERLRGLNLEDVEYGGARRRMLEQRWGEHLEAVESREVAVLTSSRRGEMAKLDPLAALHVRRPVAALNGGER